MLDIKWSSNWIGLFTAIIFAPLLPVNAQEKALVNTSKSPYAKQVSVDMDAVKWTDGFWGHWADVSKDTMAMNMLHIYENDTLSHGFLNFEIAAGYKEGRHRGAPFHDGDFYKTLEALVSVYASTKDQRYYDELERIITVIADAQRADGYIHTSTIIKQRNNPENAVEFEDRMNFETYNMGHLMTAASLHYRITGQTDFLDIAIKATDFLVAYHENATAEQAQNAICPSHYMGVIEMYRTTRNKEYLDLAGKMIDIRGMITDGTDHNQDRIPFRQQREAVGHAVRANYLYAGVADLYAETGEDSLMMALESIWKDVVTKKLYITGATGALYDGVSPNGTTYKQSIIQQVHQAYGQAFQLPNISAYNETCANIGNVLWNHRMLLVTGDSRFADILELSLINSVLSGTDLGGTNFNYTNPLRVDKDLPFTFRWNKVREPYISKSNCCPPNVVRTVAETHNYAYALSDNGLVVNLYGSNELKTSLPNGSSLALKQETDYPWDGKIKLSIEKTGQDPFAIDLRIPAWASQANITVNGEKTDRNPTAGSYFSLFRNWKKGDVIELNLPMKARLMEANPLVEETRNQVAVVRGPIVYCIESPDLQDVRIFDVELPAAIQFTPVKKMVKGSSLTFLEGQALLQEKPDWAGKLYQEVDQKNTLNPINIRLIPYFAWGNRGESEMAVWMPLKK
ncbi:aceric acid hydrolase [Cyclobacterium amurskyense]|uniref:ATP-binding protein n=1 Tax=Cyclobacterium amurskyense TaxID=320787 RepID=A0A0H4PV66_9BACT|nr:glycoside hydrolase family 127 protein [Cyclobacterium amurskyense]AKP52262.1 ATP-binding protein [Cyclobacterium amurskyense]